MSTDRLNATGSSVARARKENSCKNKYRAPYFQERNKNQTFIGYFFDKQTKSIKINFKKENIEYDEKCFGALN